MNHPINTTTDLIRAAAECLIARDPDGLERLQRINEDWMQGPAEYNAQRLLLAAMREAADLINDGSDLEDEIVNDSAADDDEHA